MIPLRPLTLSDLYNGAIGYIRANPKVTLGLTAIVVVALEIFGAVLVYGLLNALGVNGHLIRLVTLLITAVGNVLLIGMLTTVVGRAVFGAAITLRGAWEIVRPRFPALLGLTALLAGAAGGIALVSTMMLTAIAAAASTVAAIVVGVPLTFAVAGLLLFAYAILSFAPAVVVLERQPVMEALRRSYALARADVWRILGILLLTGLIAGLLASVVSFPFTVVGMVAGHSTDLVNTTPEFILFSSVGAAIGRILVLPFSAGVTVLLYVDRRIRTERFDLVLRNGAASAQYRPEATDRLWLTPAQR